MEKSNQAKIDERLKLSRSMKKKNKAAKKLIAKERINVKKPSMSSNPSRQVAKNSLANMRMLADFDIRQKHINKAVSKILLSATSPADYAPVRITDGFETTTTAVANPLEREAVTWTALETPGGALTDTCCFLFRDPFRFAVFPYTVVGSLPAYSVDFSSNPIAITSIPSPLQLGPLAHNPASGAAVHGPLLFPGRAADNFRSFYWLEATGTITITSSTPAIQVFVDIFQYTQTGVVSALGRITAASGSPGVAVVPASGYYGFSASGSLAAGSTAALLGNVSVTVPAGVVWAHRALPDIEDVKVTAKSIQIAGASMMFSNKAGPLVRQGYLAAKQLPKGSDWLDFTKPSILGSLHQSYQDGAINGYYGFHKPVEVRDLAFRNTSTFQGGNLVGAYYPLEPESGVLACAITVTEPSGRDMYLTIAAAVQFETTSMWHDLEVPNISAESVTKALTFLSHIPQHHENPSHLSDLWESIKQGASDGWEAFKGALPNIVSGAEKVASLAATLALVL